MAVQRVNPNRMELMQLKKQLSTARRGHKLLKDKRDELMRQFLLIVKDNARLRSKVEDLLSAANSEMLLARAVMQKEVIETAMMSGRESLELNVSEQNIMSVQVPVFAPLEAVSAKKKQLPYAMSSAGPELDQAITVLEEVLPSLIDLASLEKKTQLLAFEIEKTRRRVNSLEYRLIPDLEDTIREVTMKMEENERANLTRLMKVKELILEEKLAK